MQVSNRRVLHDSTVTPVGDITSHKIKQLTNDEQACSVREQLVRLEQAREFAIANCSGRV
jgi:hypothetical protein